MVQQAESSEKKPWLKPVFRIVVKHTALCVAVVLLSVITVCFFVLIPALIGKCIDALRVTTSNGSTTLISQLVLFLVLAGIARSVFGYFLRVALFNLTYRSETDIRRMIYARVSRLQFSALDDIDSGEIISRSNSDVKTIQKFLVQLPFTVIAFGSFIASLIYMLSISVTLTLVAVAVLPITLACAWRLRALMFPLSWLVQSRNASLTGAVGENVHGHELVKIFSQESRALQQIERLSHRLRWATLQSIGVKAVYNPFIERLAMVSQLAVLLVGGWLAIEGQIDIGDIVAFNIYVALMQIPFSTLGPLIVNAQRSAAAWGRIDQVLGYPIENTTDGQKLAAVDTSLSIKFDQVSLRFGAPEADEHDRKVLDKISFDISPGETIGLVGRTASGKSSIARLLMGFYPPSSGTIEIDGHNILSLSKSSLRDQIAFFENRPFIFSLPLRDNLQLFDETISEEQLQASTRLASLEHVVNDMEHGIDTLLAERGQNLSGGQRQRVGIARQLSRDVSIVVFDDATSSVDLATERTIQSNLAALFDKTTTIIISNRGSTLSKTDRVFFLDNGKIQAEGTHHSLSNTNHDYASLIDTYEEK